MLLSIYQHTSTQRYLLPLPTTACAPLHTRDMLVLRSKRFALRAKRVHHARARAPRCATRATRLSTAHRPGIPGQRGCCLSRNLPLACNWMAWHTRSERLLSCEATQREMATAKSASCVQLDLLWQEHALPTLACHLTLARFCLSQRSLHNTPIFRLLLKVAVNGTHQCDSFNFCGSFGPQLRTTARAICSLHQTQSCNAMCSSISCLFRKFWFSKRCDFRSLR